MPDTDVRLRAATGAYARAPKTGHRRKPDEFAASIRSLIGRPGIRIDRDGVLAHTGRRALAIAGRLGIPAAP